MLHSPDREVPRARTQGTIALATLLAPGLAVAEVSDKIPSLLEIWGVAGLAAFVLLLAARFRPSVLLPTLLLATMWFMALLVEIHAPDVGPVILREQGLVYVMQAYAAGALIVGGGLVGWTWRRRAMQAASTLAIK